MIRRTYYGKLFHRFFGLKVVSRRIVMHLVISAVLRTSSFLLIPFMASEIIASIETQNYSGAILFISLFAISATFHLICHHYNFWAYYIAANDIHNILQRRILKKISELDANFTTGISKAALMSTAFQDVDVARKVPDYFCDMATNLLGIMMAVVILCFVDPVIGLIAVGLLIISMLLFIHHTKRRDHYRLTMREQADEISGLYSQIIDGYREVQTLNIKENLKEYLAHSKKSWQKYHKKQRFHRDFASGAIPFLIGFGRVLIYFVCVELILKGEYTIATLVLVIGYYENIITRYDNVCGTVDNVSRSSVAIERLSRLLNFKTPHMLEFGENDKDDIKGIVEFKKVYFDYDEPPDKAPDGTLLENPIEKAPSFKNISFEVQPQSLTAIVGKTGSGKSTIFRLLLRLYKISKGKILIDGVDIYDYTKEVHATNVSIVTQKPFVFDMTIRENLNLVNSDKKAQVKACKMAEIHDDIMKLEDGYDTMLRRDAENLSVGQKQLLSLARTLLSRSEILLFDEVTANLDAVTTAKIMTILKKLKKDHTVIMITHKPDLMRMVDELIVVDKGKLVAQGKHKKLMRGCKIYKELQRGR